MLGKIGLVIEEIFGFDLRSLALFRIALGLIILLDLIVRATALDAFYTDLGVLPRTIFTANLNKPGFMSLHLAGGSAAWETALFIIAAVFAVFLIVGYRTRLATIVSWFLLISLQTRNPIVLQGGDVLLRMLLFWSMFLPLGARYSLDSIRTSILQPLPKRIFTMATVAFFMQILFVYWFSVMFKTAPEWRIDGTAVYYALSLDHFTTSFGNFLLQFPPLLKLLTHATFWFELIGPFLLLIPIAKVRVFVVASFIALHMGFRSGMELGPFPWVGSLAMFPFLPSWFWDNILSKFQTRSAKGVKIYYDGECGFCKKASLFIQTFFFIPHTQVLPAQDDPSIHEDMERHNSWVIVDAQGKRYFKFQAMIHLFSASALLWPLAPLLRWRPSVYVGNKCYEFVAARRVCSLNKHVEPQQTTYLTSSPATNALVFFFLVYVFLWNAGSLPDFPYHISPKFVWIGDVLRIDQKWNMFSPRPPYFGGWHIVVGELANGKQVDLFRDGAEVSWEKPKLASSLYKNERWRKYMMNLDYSYKTYRIYLARYLCRDWNKEHDHTEQLQKLTVYFMKEETRKDYQKSEHKKVTYIQHDCASKPTQ